MDVIRAFKLEQPISLRGERGLGLFENLDLAAAKYDGTCLGREDTIPAHLIEKGVGDIVGVLGIFGSAEAVGNVGTICSAFRIEWDIVVTARHCLYQKDTNRKRPYDATDLTFNSLRENVPIPVHAEIPNHYFRSERHERIDHENDYILLELVEIERDQPFPKIAFDRPEVG